MKRTYLVTREAGWMRHAAGNSTDRARLDLLTWAHMPIFAFGKARTMPLSPLAPPLPLLPPRAWDRQKPSKPGTLHIWGEFEFVEKAPFLLLPTFGTSNQHSVHLTF